MRHVFLTYSAHKYQVLSELLIDSAMSHALSAADSDSFDDFDDVGFKSEDRSNSVDSEDTHDEEDQSKKEKQVMSPLVLQVCVSVSSFVSYRIGKLDLVF